MGGIILQSSSGCQGKQRGKRSAGNGKRSFHVSRPDFDFCLMNGSQDGPNLRFAAIEKYWDRFPVL
jgi:hypothetical protein